mmetsp:Transcript_29376/g.32982  ORF Transcript_29376/g.32982 Transcript_29376/m.32982 type:complete len:219 (-) Transcript_29376:96-752(-)
MTACTSAAIMNDKDDIEVGYYRTFSSTSCLTTPKNKTNNILVKQKSKSTDSGMISIILKLTMTAAVIVVVVITTTTTTTTDITNTHYSSSSSSSSSIKKDIPLSSLSTSLLGIRSNGDNKCEIASGTFGGFSEAKDLDDDHDKQTNFETCFRKGKTNEYCWSKSYEDDNWLGITSWEPCKPNGFGDDNGWAYVAQGQADLDDDINITNCGAPCTLFSN